jgi:hypothetical protein
MKRPAFAAVFVLLTGLLAGPSPVVAATVARPFDFDGDGYLDLVVGAPDLSLRTVRFAGGVVILPASATGLSLTEKLVTQSSRGVPGASEPVDEFGKSVASADFDRDGYADLAVGQPGERVGTLDLAGAVTVVYGSPRGLDTMRSVATTAPSGPEERAYFGQALAAGDFNADGYPDLAIGTPSDEVDERGGSVTLLPGGPAGVALSGWTLLRTDFVLRFGSALAAGDLDGDATTDLVVGAGGHAAPFPRLVGGSVSACLGKPGGPTECSFVQGGDGFLAGMTTLAVVNMMGTPRPQILAGSPLALDSRAGGLEFLELAPGTPVQGERVRILAQRSAGVPGSDESGDRFGYSLATGDIDRDGYDDVAVGADGEDRGAGRVTVIHGAPAGWRTSGNYIYDQNTPGVPGGAEQQDRFGSSITLIDHNRDGRLDMTIGAQGENDRRGAITTLRGSGRGFTTTGSRTFGLATLGWTDPAEASFGATLGR